MVHMSELVLKYISVKFFTVFELVKMAIVHSKHGIRI